MISASLRSLLLALRKRWAHIKWDARDLAGVALLLAFLYRRFRNRRALETPQKWDNYGNSRWPSQGFYGQSRGSNGNSVRSIDEGPLPRCKVCGRTPAPDRRGKVWPWIRASLVGETDTVRMQLHCARDILAGTTSKSEVVFEQGFETELRELLEVSPEILKAAAAIRLCHEDWHLTRCAEQPKLRWPMDPPTHPPARAIFALEHIPEMRISSCPLFKEIPAGTGACKGLRVLVFISTGISKLPEELGALHEMQILYLNGNFISAYPKSMAANYLELEELCLDANQLQELPAIASQKLKLLTAPANRLTSCPIVSSPLERIELHGNCLPSISFTAPRYGLSQPPWTKMYRLKLMGNQLSKLPEEIGLMKNLQSLAVADNCLRALPRSIVNLRKLAWVLLYNNQLAELPEGMVAASADFFETLLLEGNPLSALSVAAILEDLPKTRIRLLGLDAAQVRAVSSVYQGWRTLPWNVSVGNLLHTNSLHQYYMKLIRGSQIKRMKGIAAEGEPNGPPGPSQAPAEVLIVCFSASQGEPEWMGLMARLSGCDAFREHAPVEGALADELKELMSGGSECNAQLWSGCRVQAQEDVEFVPPMEPHHLADFDVLSLCDHRMRWYVGDEEALSQSLASIARRYKHKVFIGASMGGFGALLHAGRLAREGCFGPTDAVVAFGPQAVLTTATLRPPAASLDDLQDLATRMAEAARTAGESGAIIEVHCAADEHLGHALAIPLRDMALNVHPIVPRKPFAKLLDKASILLPIVSDAIARVISRRPDDEPLPPPPSRGSDHHEARAVLARWVCPDGLLKRNWIERYDLMQMFFGPGAAQTPRPGDWYCRKCSVRNQNSFFFCSKCGIKEGPLIMEIGNARIPNGQMYPRTGDWGCGACGKANCKYHNMCDKCGAKKDSHPDTYIYDGPSY